MYGTRQSLVVLLASVTKGNSRIGRFSRHVDAARRDVRDNNMTLLEFLRGNETAILANTEVKSLQLAGAGPTSQQLKLGLPLFFKQLMNVLEQAPAIGAESTVDHEGLIKAAFEADEPAIAMAAGRPHEAEVAQGAGAFGTELQKLGYTLSHVVHSYGSICQSITELAMEKQVPIGNGEFRQLNQCLDTAIAGAVTSFQKQRAEGDAARETEYLGCLAHELRNSLSVVSVSLRLIKSGTVGFTGSTGQVMDKALKRIEELVDHSLTEARLRVELRVHKTTAPLFQLVDQILITAEVEAQAKNQSLEIEIDPVVEINADQYLMYSAVSNLVQNAIKYTCRGGTIRIRGSLVNGEARIEVEDECGGLRTSSPSDLFKPFEQRNPSREGLGLGLTIAKRAVELNDGMIEAENLSGRGCIFRISLPGTARATSSGM
jgi:hypothetical protein